MIIHEDKNIRSWLIGEIQTNLSDIREGLHLTDLMYPRRAYFQRTIPKKITEDEALYFTAGRGHESALARISDIEKAEVKEWNGIKYSIDFYQSMPIELKTTRRNIAIDNLEEKYDTYIDQLRKYCAVTDKQQGWLWVISLVEKQDDNSTKPTLRTYRVEFTKEELEIEREKMLIDKGYLELALRNEISFTLLPLCLSWMCGKESRTMIKKPFCKNCNKKFSTEWGIEKHINSKTGKGHEITMPEYETNYIKRCKWFDECHKDNSMKEVKCTRYAS